MNAFDRLNKLAGWPEQDEYAKTVNRRIASICLTVLIVGMYVEVIGAYFFLSHDDFGKITIALFLPLIPVATVATILRWKSGMFKYNREMVNKDTVKKKRAVTWLMISSLGFSVWTIYQQYSWEHSSLFEAIVFGLIGGVMWGGIMYWLLMRKRKSDGDPIIEKNT
jgi:hypothetical protein